MGAVTSESGRKNDHYNAPDTAESTDDEEFILPGPRDPLDLADAVSEDASNGDTESVRRVLRTIIFSRGVLQPPRGLREESGAPLRSPAWRPALQDPVSKRGEVAFLYVRLQKQTKGASWWSLSFT